jgi:hypothetical protein
MEGALTMQALPMIKAGATFWMKNPPDN